ncbi:IPT/TIG domain-containing protein [Streptomyces sp. NPDC057638]|uniref:IPT/TIG domain-containing protein n=1 Tax=Streptomyces sp. NPDC057638 TaxID=3346190 RepID=UPI0036A45770
MADNPKIESLSPKNGSAEGGYSVTIHGEHFTNTTDVWWNGKVVSFVAESIKVVKIEEAPAGTAGLRIPVKLKADGHLSNEVFFQYDN